MGKFEFDGKKYQDGSSHQKEWGIKLIAELTLRGDEKILDLGCGDGALTKQLAGIALNGTVIGVDASEGMIKVAKEITGKNLSFRLLDIDDLDFKDEFDLIFSNAALHWVKDHHKLLQNCYTALKFGGMLRFNFAGHGNCANFYEVVKEVMELKRYRKFFSNFDWPWYMPRVEDYQQNSGLAVFKDIKVWEENADRFFPNDREMIKWIDQPSIVPFIKLIAENERDGFRNEVVERMIKKTKQLNGTCFETFRRINVIAYK